MRTMIWKEWRSLLSGGTATSGAGARGALRLLPPAVLRYLSASRIRILLTPVVLGAIAGSGAHMRYVFALVVVFAGALIGAESFAGERERGTLETLLASPLSDAAITGGKLIAGWLYAAGLAVVFLAVMVPVRLAVLGMSSFSAHWAAQVAVSTVMMLLLAFVVIGVAALVSTWAQTTRVAMQTTYIAVLGVGALAALAGKLHLAPAVGRFVQHLAVHGWTPLGAAGFGACLLVLDGAAYSLVRLRCTRATLLARI